MARREYFSCKIYVRLDDGRCGIAEAESARKYFVRLGADGPTELHWKSQCMVITRNLTRTFTPSERNPK